MQAEKIGWRGGRERKEVNNVERGDEEEWARASREDINFK
jgi:hypothetical protein